MIRDKKLLFQNWIKEKFRRLNSLISVLRLVWDCKPRLVVLIFSLTVISSLIPFAQTVIAKYALDSIIAAVGSKGAWADVRLVMIFVGMEFLLVAAGRFLSQYLELQREILGEIFSKSASGRIIEKAVSLDLAHFEDPVYYDKLQKAQRDGNYRPVQLLNQMFTLLENTVSIGSFFTLLLTFKWYFLFLILLAVVPRTWVQFRYANRKYSMINTRTPEQRKVNYFSYLLSNNIFAKEIKLFSLGNFFLDKYRIALDKFYKENRSLAEKRTRANVLTGVLAALSSYGAYGIIIYETVLGHITIGSMTMYYQAFSRSQSSLDSFLKTIAGLYENMLYIRNYLEFMEVEGEIEGRQASRHRGIEASRRQGNEALRDQEIPGGSEIDYSNHPDPVAEFLPDISLEFRNISFAYPAAGVNGKIKDDIPDRRGASSQIPDRRGKACLAPAETGIPNQVGNGKIMRGNTDRRGVLPYAPSSRGQHAPAETVASLPSTAKPDYILKDISFRINRGQVLAIVGENGAGKSTVVKLITRLYDPNEGSVFLGGHDMRELAPEFIRKHMSVLFQDFNHYQLLVKDNIKVGDISSSNGEDRVRAVSRLTGAEQFINSLPEGFDTQLGRWFEKGRELSIGQWQRIALARGFMRDAPILIFDEPTSHLDARAESEIFKSIEKFRKDKIVIVISHRLKTVRQADTIIVLQKGALAEAGPHDELMDADGLYANLFNLQAEGYGKT